MLRSAIVVPTDHPRSRGEHSITGVDDDFACGSSPLTRGALLARHPHSQGSRIIPAHAGSTVSSRLSRSAATDHPRSRGEHGIKPVLQAFGDGSSPLTRGARIRHRPLTRLPRIIPAHAGSTDERGEANGLAADHPRSRGEHLATAVWGIPDFGSSPLTRGALVQPLDEDHEARIIPAHAGSTHAAG